MVVNEKRGLRPAFPLLDFVVLNAELAVYLR